MRILLGISITLNVICGIIFFIMYKYSFKGMKKRLEDQLINNFIDEDTKDFILNFRSEEKDDHK